MKKVKINGIRLNKNYIQVTQEYSGKQDNSCLPLYQILASNKINMVFTSLNTLGNRYFISGSIASKYFKKISYKYDYLSYYHGVCTISIYPHNYQLHTLGVLLNLLGKKKISFQYIVSSNALLTLVVDQKDCDAIVDIFSDNFDLPDSHVPFEQEENEELTQFLKKRYPETRATYVEEKIKTYGIKLETDLNLNQYVFSFDKLAEYGQNIHPMEDKFLYISANMESPKQIRLFLLTEPKIDILAQKTSNAELISFYGPHLGDRHSIISRALNCLSEHSIKILLAGCTGASICLVLPQGKGKVAQKALMNVFEAP
jgi:aspartokinase